MGTVYSHNAMPICYLLCVFFILLRCAVCVVEVVRQVEVGELWCDSLTDAQDSLLLRIAVSSTEVRVKVKALAESYRAP